MTRNASSTFVRKYALVALSLGTCTAIANAGPTIFAGYGSTLFRIDDMGTTPFALSEDITGTAFDGSGVLWASGRFDADGNGSHELYTIDDPFGTPTLTLVSDGLSTLTQSLEWVDGTLYGVQRDLDNETTTRLVTINSATGTHTNVGATGNTSIRISGIARDASTGTMYAKNNLFGGRLATLDWELQSNTDPLSTDIGPFGFPSHVGGLDFFESNNTLYATLADVSDTGGDIFNSDVGVYDINTATGQAVLLHDLGPYPDAIGGGFSVSVIPEPSALLLLLTCVPLMRGRNSQG